jgi:hypothetical protein
LLRELRFHLMENSPAFPAALKTVPQETAARAAMPRAAADAEPAPPEAEAPDRVQQ